MLTRRKMLGMSLGALAAPAVLGSGCARQAEGARQGERTYRIGYSGYAWGRSVGGTGFEGDDIAAGIEWTARFGYEGIEPFPQNVGEHFLQNPQELKDRLDAAGIALVTIGGTIRSGGSLIDPAGVPEAIENHVATARDFLQVFGCNHFKINIGGGRAEAPTDAQLGTLADALNEMGRRTLDYGVRIAPHPHIWTPLERPEEIALVAERTDPELVFFTADTAHLQLGGTDPVWFTEEYFPRIAAFHIKDAHHKYRGYTGPTPSQEEHERWNLYLPMGAGAVDFPALSRLLADRGFDNWATLDYNPPREHEGTLEQQFAHHRWYLTEILGYTLGAE